MRSVDARVVHVVEPRRLEVRRETLVLEGLGFREIAAQTLYTALSPGTELAAYEGLRPLRPDRTHSRVVGYCNLARVVATGEWVTALAPGDLILTLQSHRSHFVCDEDEILFKLPEVMEGYTEDQLVRASTTYLFHQGHSALLRGDLKPGQYVAVLGLGTLGLATVAVASRFGARVFGFSNQPENRQRALEFGAAGAYEKPSFSEADEPAVGGRLNARGAAASKPAWRSDLDRATRGTGVDIVVTTSELWADWRAALELARPGGTVCVLGFPGRRQPRPDYNPLDPAYFYRKQLSLIACGYTPDVDVDPRDIRFTAQRNVAYLLDMVLSEELPAEQLISCVASWRDLDSLYQRIESRDHGFLTAVLDWTEVEDD